jgi:hypothetical protein
MVIAKPSSSEINLVGSREEGNDVADSKGPE